MPQGKPAWVELAKSRILNVLKIRIAANVRQLEVKISESGPPDLRPEPHILHDALKDLHVHRIIRPFTPGGEGKREESQFYTLPDYYPEPAASRVSDLLVPFRFHYLLTHKNEYCGDVLENIVRASFDAAGKYKYLDKGDKRAPLDGVYTMGPEKIGLEVKNIREWIYPTGEDIWVMVAKCLQIGALPFLVTRKTSFHARKFLDELGIEYFEVFRQFFSKRVAPYLHEIQHKDMLGYKDVIAVDIAPNPHLAKYLAETLPAKLAAQRARWDMRRHLLTEFAVTRGLGSKKMTSKERHKHYEDLRRALFPSDHEEIEDEYAD